MKILLVGMSHHSAPVEVRERFAVSDLRSALLKVVASEEIEEAVIISTCNRVEIVATTHQPEAARHHLQRFFEREESVTDTLPTPAVGQGYYYVTAVNYQGQRRYGRQSTGGVLTGRDPAVLPVCAE